MNFVRGFPYNDLFERAASTLGGKLMGSSNGLGSGGSGFLVDNLADISSLIRFGVYKESKHTMYMYIKKYNNIDYFF